MIQQAKRGLAERHIKTFVAAMVRLGFRREEMIALLRQETGIPFRQHVRRRRMEMAKTMLADPRLSIAEIAQAVGYSQYTTFYNLFREMEWVSPTDYRNSLL